jgi:hypothetical protein
MFLPLSQQQALQNNQILVFKMLQLKTSTVERRENIKKPIIKTDLIIPLSTASGTQNTGN